MGAPGFSDLQVLQNALERFQGGAVDTALKTLKKNLLKVFCRGGAWSRPQTPYFVGPNACAPSLQLDRVSSILKYLRYSN